MAPDITPHDIDAVIDLNVHEESAVWETVAELAQRFPEEALDTLRRRVRQRLEEGARAGRIAFFVRKRPNGTMEELTREQGLECLPDSKWWCADGDDHLVACAQDG